MAGKRQARKLVVSAATDLTPNMRRVTLQGEDLASFPQDAEGAYFKLALPVNGAEKPVLRTYTVARYRPQLNEIDVDFMLHSNSDESNSGVASTWALQAKPGEPLSIFGPGRASFINTNADWYLLAADMAALPALIANLARLPAEANGYVVIEIINNEDKQTIYVPDGMTVIWVINSQPGSDSSPLYHTIKELDWASGRVAVWAACEFTTMKKIRQYLRQDKNVAKTHLYISSYWKKGLQEEQHKVAKRVDASANIGGLTGVLKKIMTRMSKT